MDSRSYSNEYGTKFTNEQKFLQDHHGDEIMTEDKESNR